MENNSNYLAHYGVIGMKWGIRRYQNKDGTLTELGKKKKAETGSGEYEYRSGATKKYTRRGLKQRAGAEKAEREGNIEKSKKLTAKAEISERRAARSKELDKRELDYAKSTGLGLALTVRLLEPMGINGTTSKAYQQLSAMGKTTAESLIGSYLGGTLYSRIRKAQYLREGEKK